MAVILLYLEQLLNKEVAGLPQSHKDWGEMKVSGLLAQCSTLQPWIPSLAFPRTSVLM